MMKIPQNKFEFAPAGLKKILGDEPWHINQDGTLLWQSEKISEPSEAKILASIDEAEQEHKTNQYQRERKNEFPSWREQLDYIFHHGIEKWKTDIIQPVKNKFPKP